MIDLAPAQLDTIRQLLAEHVPECEVRAFGSRVTWTAKDYSDLDFAVVGPSRLPMDRLESLREAFQASALPIRVDLLDWHAISEEFRQVILRRYEVIQEAKSGGMAGNWEETTLGECADWLSGGTPFKGREMALNQVIKALRPAGNVDSSFLAYWLLAHKSDLLASVDHAGHGTGRLVTDTLKAKAVRLPTLAEQKAIAAVLGALDDKIELNQRMNATLEAMARALFQSWFVDFDPVRAKSGRFQASPIHAAPQLLSRVHASGHGTGVLSTEFLDRLEFAIPPDDICSHLTQPLEALNAKIAANNQESRTLAALRDTLLPKLLSGELRVIMTEKEVSSHV